MLRNMKKHGAALIIHIWLWRIRNFFGRGGIPAWEVEEMLSDGDDEWG